MKDKWDDYVPEGAHKVVVYANHVFWYDINNEIICDDPDMETFNRWVCESCETLVRHGFPDTEQVC